MHYLLSCLILATCTACIMSQLPLLSYNVSRQFDVVVIGEDETNIFGPESHGVYCAFANISELKSPSNNVPTENIIVLIRTWDLEDVFRNLLQISQTHCRRWLYFILLDGQITRNDMRLLQKFAETNLAKYLKIDSEIFIVPRIGSKFNHTVVAVELYAIKDLILVERFSISIPLQNVDLVSTFIRRQNFWKEPIRAVAQPLEAHIPGQLTTAFVKNKFKFISGFDFDMLEFISDALNFSIVPVPGTGFVRRHPNGSLTGMARQVLRDEADVSMVSQKMLVERKEHLTFLFPTGRYIVKAFLQRRSNNRLKDILFRAFELSIWLLLVSVWVILAFSMWIIRKLKQRWNDLTANDDLIGGHSFIWAAGTARQVGWHILPDSSPMRIIFLCGHLMGLVIYNAYSAAFTSILSTDSTLIQTPQDIAQYQYKVLLDDAIEVLNIVVERLEGKHVDQKSLATKKVNYSVAVPSLYKSHVAYISDPELFFPGMRKYLHCATNLSSSEIDAKICNDIVEIGVAHTSSKSAWFVKKNSPLASFFNQKFALMAERGLVDRYKSTFSRDNTVNCPKRKTAVEASEPMILTDIWTVYIILFVGTLVSVVLLLVEKTVFKLVLRYVTF